MKQRLFIAISLLVTFGLSSCAFTGGKPPKTLCLELSGSGFHNGHVLILNFKRSGIKTKTSVGITKFYHVQGALGSPPGIEQAVSGTAYWNTEDPPPGAKGIVSGGPVTDPVMCSFSVYDKNIDMLPHINCKNQSEPAGGDYSYSVTLVDCNELYLY